MSFYKNPLVSPVPPSVDPNDPLNLNDLLGPQYGTDEPTDPVSNVPQGFARENSFSSTASDPPYIVEMEEEPDVRPRRSAKVKRNTSFAHSDVVKYRRAFNTHDYKKDGTVVAGDLQAIVKRIGYRLKEEQVEIILSSHGLQPNSHITFEQFLDLIPRNETHITDDDHKMADLREKFQRYDHDNKGQISLQEAQWALQVELKISPNTALRLLNQFVKLNYEQFVDFYQQVQAKKLEIYEKFGRYDQDQDGMISAEEAHEVLQEELGFTAERSRAMVARYDQNKDGLVSYMEFAEFYIAVEERKNKIRAAFRHFDVDGQGYVSLENAEKILKDCLGFSDGKCAKAIETFHKDGNVDKMYYEEFLKFYSMVEEERHRLMAEFTRYDSDQDGRISYDEFKSMLQSQGYKDEEVETLMAGYDLNQDGYLDFDEFKMFLNFQE